MFGRANRAKSTGLPSTQRIVPDMRSRFGMKYHWGQRTERLRHRRWSKSSALFHGSIPDSGQHYIYLFLDVDELGVRKLKRVRFDLDLYQPDSNWESEAVDLDVSGLTPLHKPKDTPIAVQI